MITHEQNVERTLQRSKLCEENGAQVKRISIWNARPFIIRADDEDSFGFRRITYFATTNWGGYGVLSIDLNDDGTRDLRWSHDGHCDDVTSLEIARVMHAIWKDALEVLSAGRTN